MSGRKNPHARRFTQGVSKHFVDALRGKFFGPYDGLLSEYPEFERIEGYLPFQHRTLRYDLITGELEGTPHTLNESHPLHRVLAKQRAWFHEQVQKRELDLADVEEAVIEITVGERGSLERSSETVYIPGELKRDETGYAYLEKKPPIRVANPESEPIPTLKIRYRIALLTRDGNAQWEDDGVWAFRP